MSTHIDETSPSIAQGYSLHVGYPPIPAYLNLRARSGLTPVREDQARNVASGSWYGVYVVHDATADYVAMGRIIGDGSWYFHIADMATLQEHQRKGLGSVIMQALLNQIKRDAPPGAYVNLIADRPGWRLYEKFKFLDVSKPNMVSGKGMYMLL